MWHPLLPLLILVLLVDFAQACQAIDAESHDHSAYFQSSNVGLEPVPTSRMKNLQCSTKCDQVQYFRNEPTDGRKQQQEATITDFDLVPAHKKHLQQNLGPDNKDLYANVRSSYSKSCTLSIFQAGVLTHVVLDFVMKVGWICIFLFGIVELIKHLFAVLYKLIWLLRKLSSDRSSSYFKSLFNVVGWLQLVIHYFNWSWHSDPTHYGMKSTLSDLSAILVVLVMVFNLFQRVIKGVTRCDENDSVEKYPNIPKKAEKLTSKESSTDTENSQPAATHQTGELTDADELGSESPLLEILESPEMEEFKFPLHQDIEPNSLISSPTADLVPVEVDVSERMDPACSLSNHFSDTSNSLIDLAEVSVTDALPSGNRGEKTHETNGETNCGIQSVPSMPATNLRPVQSAERVKLQCPPDEETAPKTGNIKPKKLKAPGVLPSIQFRIDPLRLINHCLLLPFTKGGSIECDDTPCSELRGDKSLPHTELAPESLSNTSRTESPSTNAQPVTEQSTLTSALKQTNKSRITVELQSLRNATLHLCLSNESLSRENCPLPEKTTSMPKSLKSFHSQIDGQVCQETYTKNGESGQILSLLKNRRGFGDKISPIHMLPAGVGRRSPQQTDGNPEPLKTAKTPKDHTQDAPNKSADESDEALASEQYLPIKFRSKAGIEEGMSHAEAQLSGFKVIKDGLWLEVLCESCGLKLNEQDIPEDKKLIDIHVKYSPDCPFILSKTAGTAYTNIKSPEPLDETDGEGPTSAIPDTLTAKTSPTSTQTTKSSTPIICNLLRDMSEEGKDAGLDKVISTAALMSRYLQSSGESEGTLETLGLRKNENDLQQMGREENRKKTFLTYPNHKALKLTGFVDNGWFWIGVEDEFKCFRCDVVCSDWHSSVDPLARHIQLSPDCPFLLAQYTPEYRERISKENPTYTTPKPQDVIKNPPTRHQQIRSLAETGYATMMVDNYSMFYDPIDREIVSADDGLNIRTVGKNMILTVMAYGVQYGIELNSEDKILAILNTLRENKRSSQTSAVDAAAAAAASAAANAGPQAAALLESCMSLGLRKNENGLQQMGREENRKKTFQFYPNHKALKLTGFVDNGWFWTGVEDEFKCFRCDVVCSDWNSSVVPLTRHMQLSPECPFLLTRYTPEYRERISKENPTYTTPKPQDVIKNPPSGLIRPHAETRYATMIVDNYSNFYMKIEREIVSADDDLDKRTVGRKMIWRVMSYSVEYGIEVCSEDKILTILNTIRENKQSPQPSASVAAMMVAVPEPGALPYFISFDEATREKLFKSTHPTSKPKAQSMKIVMNVEEVREQLRCTTCLDSIRSLLFTPCCHLAACAQCGFKQDLCPVCRKNIQATIKVNVRPTSSLAVKKKLQRE